jgi:uncharacterized HhH-GPD family protein
MAGEWRAAPRGRYHAHVPTTPARLYFTEDDEANALLAGDPMALLIGFLLDQQVSVLKAFGGPLELKRRIGSLDARHIADLDPAALDAAFRERPALHRFPGSMAGKARELALAIVERYDGDPMRIWSEAKDGADLERRLRGLPGIGEMKASTLVGILGRRFGVQPPGWERVAKGHPTLADVDSSESLARYREAKAAIKAQARGESG